MERARILEELHALQRRINKHKEWHSAAIEAEIEAWSAIMHTNMVHSPVYSDSSHSELASPAYRDESLHVWGNYQRAVGQLTELRAFSLCLTDLVNSIEEVDHDNDLE